MKRALAVTALALGLATSSGAQEQPARTIVDANGDNLLEYGPAEAYAVRVNLVPALPGREARRRLLISFGHVTDTQLVDEESPARVEFVDAVESFDAAYRPDEGLMPHVLSEQIRALRREPIELVMTTGDNVDNSQLNETRLFIGILDGGLVNPDSGVRGTCKTAKRGPLYSGVRGAGRYYEPDRSSPRVDGPGYAAAERENRRRARTNNALRDYPRLLERMNRPFRAPGLAVPWYSVFGNHDALVQGNLPSNPFFSEVAAGCKKVADLSQRAWGLIRPLAAGGVTDQERGEIIRILYGDVLVTLADPKAPKRLYRMVPRDPGRALLPKTRYMQEHFSTRGRPVGHGYSADNVARGEGNYSFSPKPGLRFVTLDTVADTGPDGNLDDAQFRWLEGELLAAEARRELVLVFGHHSLRTMRQTPPEGSAPVHYGLGSCVSPGPEPLSCLLRRHPGVIAYVVGHEHRDRIEAHASYWEIVSAAHIDWPQHNRTISLYDNGDGTLSLLTRVVDTAAPPRPSRGRLLKERILPASEVTRLASIARELAFNDPQMDESRSGTPLDRNAELLIRNPY